MRNRKNLTTYPQVLDGAKGDDWKVINSGIEAIVSKSDLEAKVLVVPDGDSTIERNQRLLEMARARWSPHQSLAVLAERNDVPSEALEAAEIARLGFNIHKASNAIHTIQYSKGIIDPETIEKLFEEIECDDPKSVKGLPLLMAAVFNSEGSHRVKTEINKRREELASRTDEASKVKLAGWKRIQSHLVGLENAIKARLTDNLRRTYAGFPRSVEIAKLLVDFQEGLQGDAQATRDQLGELKKGKATTREVQALKREGKGEGKAQPIVSKFGKMYTKVPPMLMPAKAKNRIARHRVTEEGILPFQLYRLNIDGKIFLDPRRQRGGTVVVDISGSMGLKPEDVYEFVLQCPGATIAQYSGRYNDGDLVVVAHKGKIAAKDLIGNGLGGNIIDGPALEWLSRQPKPRVWVSDTAVTGVGDRGSAELREICLSWCAKHQIKIVTKFETSEVVRALHTSHRRTIARAKKMEDIYYG